MPRPAHDNTNSATRHRHQARSEPKTRRFWRSPALAAGVAAAIGFAVWMRLAPAAADRALASASSSELERITAADKTNERAFFYLGRRYGEQGQHRAAAAAYLQAVQLRPEDEAAWVGLAKATGASSGPEQAARVLESGLKLHPKSVGALTLLAELQGQMGQHQSAYDLATRAASLDPSSAEARRIMGSEAAVMEMPLEAEEAFRKAVALAPADWRSHAGLGDALSHLSRRPEAVASLREAVRLAPGEVFPRLMLGSELVLAARTETEFEAARTELQEVSKRKSSLPRPGRFQVALSLGDSYRLQRRWKEAVPWYREAEALMPSVPTVHYYLARVYRGLGDESAATKALARHRELDALDHEIKVTSERMQTAPDDGAARLKLARLFTKGGQYGRAIRAYQEVLASPSTSSLAETASKELQQVRSLAASEQ